MRGNLIGTITTSDIILADYKFGKVLKKHGRRSKQEEIRGVQNKSLEV